jgi:hypothetical protein
MANRFFGERQWIDKYDAFTVRTIIPLGYSHECEVRYGQYDQIIYVKQRTWKEEKKWKEEKDGMGWFNIEDTYETANSGEY